MRSLLVLASFLLAACHTYTSEVTGTAGEGYQDLSRLDTLLVLPVALPAEIHGEISNSEEQTFRREWPDRGARLIANGVNEQATGVTAMFQKQRPATGYYLELTVTYVDYGDAQIPVRWANLDNETKTRVLADGRIVKAETDETVAVFSFTQGTAYGIENPFEMDMYNVGRELGDWITERRREISS
jgi:hypothetical protein